MSRISYLLSLLLLIYTLVAGIFSGIPASLETHPIYFHLDDYKFKLVFVISSEYMIAYIIFPAAQSDISE